MEEKKRKESTEKEKSKKLNKGGEKAKKPVTQLNPHMSVLLTQPPWLNDALVQVEDSDGHLSS